jgi:N-methylhydantoinase B
LRDRDRRAGGGGVTKARAWIVHGQFAAMVEEMEVLFARLSRTPLLAEGRHFAVGLLDHELRLVAQNRSDPRMLFVPREAARHLLDYFAYDIAPGDIFLLGDPHRAGTGWHELTIALPVVEQDSLRYLCVLHFAVPDLGGEQPGPWQPFAIDIWQERLIVTPVRLARAGRTMVDVARLLAVNSRSRSSLEHDLTVARSVLTEMGHRVERLLNKHGWAGLQAAADVGRDYAGRRIADHLAALFPETGKPPSIEPATSLSATVRREGERVVVDMKGVDPQADDSLHSAPALSRASILLPLLAAILDDLPLNDAVLDAIDIRMPRASRLWPDPDRACSLGRFAVAGVLSSAVARAMRDAGAPAHLFTEPGADAVPGVATHPPVGSASILDPLSLSLGFVPRPDGLPAGWSASALASAEEMEQRHRLVLCHRRNEAGAMHVMIENRGADAEITVAATKDSASLSRGGARRHGMMAAESFPRGATLSLAFAEQRRDDRK